MLSSRIPYHIALGASWVPANNLCLQDCAARAGRPRPSWWRSSSAAVTPPASRRRSPSCLAVRPRPDSARGHLLRGRPPAGCAAPGGRPRDHGAGQPRRLYVAGADDHALHHAAVARVDVVRVHALRPRDHVDQIRPEKGLIPVPTVFSAARAAGLRTVLVAGKDKFRQLDVPEMIQRFDLCASDDQEVATRAIAESLAGFDLMFVHLPQTDLTGHAQGWMSSAYLDAIANADRAVARVLAVLPEGTTVIVTADHGGHDWNHGTTQAADMRIPWVAAGPHIRPHALTRSIVTTDTAATAAWVLG